MLAKCEIFIMLQQFEVFHANTVIAVIVINECRYKYTLHSKQYQKVTYKITNFTH